MTSHFTILSKIADSFKWWLTGSELRNEKEDDEAGAVLSFEVFCSDPIKEKADTGAAEESAIKENPVAVELSSFISIPPNRAS